MKKTIFFVRSFDISPYVFTQIQSRRDRWMWNLIPHPKSTHTAYFDGPRYPKNKKYLKIMQCGYSLDAELNSASNELSRSGFE